jgi:hypothetical protein
MEEHKKRLQRLLLGLEDFELIAKLAKLLPVIRMAEQVRAMTADLKADIAAKRDCRSAHRHLEMTREQLLFALSLVWFASYIVGFFT